VKRTVEREIKLRAGDGFALPGDLGEPIAPRRFSSTYHDTPDHRLAASGFTLRYRSERGSGSWQLKLPRGDDRLELELPGPPEQVPQRFDDLIAATTRGRPLLPVARLDTLRQGVMVRDHGRDLAEVVVDEVTVSGSGAAVDRLEELEVELVEGDHQSMRRIERALRAAGALDADERPKLFQALGLVRGEVRRPKRSAPPIDHLVAMLERQFQEILVHDPGTRLGTDAEDLHQHRVAIRRVRALLRAARPMLDAGWVREVRNELKWAGGALGEVRDMDVLTEHLNADACILDAREQAAFATLLDQIIERRGAARRTMLSDLRQTRYTRLLDRLETELTAPPVVDSKTDLRTIAAAEYRRLRKKMRALGDEPSDEALHAVRIAVKRARYAAELAEGAVGKPATRFITAAKRLQDVLGEHQDAAVAEQVVRDLLESATSPVGVQAAFAAGALAERQRERRRDARAAVPDAWKRLQKRAHVWS
jgi:CHAD domain-containing protein